MPVQHLTSLIHLLSDITFFYWETRHSTELVDWKCGWKWQLQNCALALCWRGFGLSSCRTYQCVVLIRWCVRLLTHQWPHSRAKVWVAEQETETGWNVHGKVVLFPVTFLVQHLLNSCVTMFTLFKCAFIALLQNFRLSLLRGHTIA